MYGWVAMATFENAQAEPKLQAAEAVLEQRESDEAEETADEDDSLVATDELGTTITELDDAASLEELEASSLDEVATELELTAELEESIELEELATEEELPASVRNDQR